MSSAGRQVLAAILLAAGFLAEPAVAEGPRVEIVVPAAVTVRFFTAAPADDRHYVHSWTDDCEDSGETGESDATGGMKKFCELPAGGVATIGVRFAPVRDCPGENRMRVHLGACGARVATRAVTFTQPAAGGTLIAAVAGTEISSGDNVNTDQAVVFTADPDDDRYVHSWTGDCAASGQTVGVSDLGVPQTCEVAAGTVAVNVGVSLAAADGGGDSRVVTFAQPAAGGTLVATVGGVAISSGDAVAVDQTVIFIAIPDDEHYVGGNSWTDDCKGRGNFISYRGVGDPKECKVGPGTVAVNVGVSLAAPTESERLRLEAGKNLILELEKDDPDEDEVVRLLRAGASPFGVAKIGDTKHLLPIYAARRGHYKVVSIFIASGIDSKVTDGQFGDDTIIPVIMADNPPNGEGFADKGGYTLALKVLKHYVAGVVIQNSSFGWANWGRRSPLNYLADRYDNVGNSPIVGAQRAKILEMAQFFRDHNGECVDDWQTGQNESDHFICNLPRSGLVPPSVCLVSPYPRRGDSHLGCPPRVVTFAQPAAGGTLSAAVTGTEFSSGADVASNQAVIFTATPDDDRYVHSWTGDCAASGQTVGVSDLGVPQTCEVAAGTVAVNVGVSLAAADGGLALEAEKDDSNLGGPVADANAQAGGFSDNRYPRRALRVPGFSPAQASRVPRATNLCRPKANDIRAPGRAETICRAASSAARSGGGAPRDDNSECSQFATRASPRVRNRSTDQPSARLASSSGEGLFGSSSGPDALSESNAASARNKSALSANRAATAPGAPPAFGNDRAANGSNFHRKKFRRRAKFKLSSSSAHRNRRSRA